ncbi:MAG: hypothetical protein JW885_15025 [Deltaproteobacteria bacterium]|nr:hypothetical protein [Candidatus Zymogenaceae bacterium]
MKKVKLFVLIGGVCALMMWATSALAVTESGYLNPGASYTFGANGPTDIYFSYPKGSVDFWVEVISPNGSVSDFDLDNGEIIQLTAGGYYTVTIWSNWGAGYWSAEYYPTSGGGGGGGSSNCNASGRSAWGYLTGPGDACSWSIYDTSGNFNVYFTYPAGSVDFWVEIVGQDGYTVLGVYDLDNSRGGINLSGGGTFYLTIYSNYGAGDWSCSW